MTVAASLWTVYAHDARPSNIATHVRGVFLGELDDTVQDVVSSYFGSPAILTTERVARLGLALDRITEILPFVEPPATKAYFERLGQLARAVLIEIAERQA